MFATILRIINITLLAMLSLCSVLARANDKADFDIFTTHINDRINKIQADIDKRGVTTTTQRQVGGATVTVAKNYPIVPYDPNHPNVKKQSSFTVKAKAKTLAGRFARGLNGVALGYAVVDMLGDGIDWVLDPENNAVKYTLPNDHGLWTDAERQIVGDIETVGVYECAKPHGKGGGTGGLVRGSREQGMGMVKCNNGYGIVYVAKDNGNLDLETIANHVINNDNSTTNITNNYYNAVNDTLVEQINKGEHDTEIATAVRNVSQPDDSPSPSPSSQDNSNPSNNPSPTMPPDVAPIGREPDNTDAKPFELPAFCDWATVVCDWIEWTKQDAKKDSHTEIDIDDDEDKIDFKPLAERSYITLPKTCPSNPKISFAMPFVAGAQTLEFPFDKFCEAFALFKIVVILFSYIRALSIVGEGL